MMGPVGRVEAAMPAPPTRTAHLCRQGAWIMHQRWHSLLFAHWRVSADVVRHCLPRGIDLDTFDGDAWVSVTPFYMTDVHFRWTPPIPTAHTFAELNVRTYVTHRGIAGVWFFSLDAESTLAVLGARLGAALPYHRAAMEVRVGLRAVEYRSDRIANGTSASFEATYAPRGPRPAGLAIDRFLTERYSLFSSDGERLWRIDIDHPNWQLHDADVTVRRNTMLEAAGLVVTGEPIVHFAHGKQVHIWRPVRVG